MDSKDDGNLSRKAKDQGAFAYSGDALKHAFVFFALFLLKINFISSFCACIMGGVGIRPFFFSFSLLDTLRTDTILKSIAAGEVVRADSGTGG